MLKINIEGEINWLYLKYDNDTYLEAFQILKKDANEVLIIDQDALNLFFVKNKEEFDAFLVAREIHMSERISRHWVVGPEKNEVPIDSFFNDKKGQEELSESNKKSTILNKTQIDNLDFASFDDHLVSRLFFRLGTYYEEAKEQELTLTKKADHSEIYEKIKSAFDLLNDDSKLEDFLAALTEEQSHALYYHPLLDHYDLLP